MPPLGDVMAQWRCPGSYPNHNWYYWAVPEGQMLGKFFVYDGLNDGDAILFAGRVMAIVMALLTGIVIFFWARRATNRDGPALVALALWAFNPWALAYGHLANTDIGVTLGMTLAIYMFGRFLERPGLKTAAICGAATGVAMTMKFTALILGPIYVLMLVLAWKRVKRPVVDLCKMAGAFLLAGWVVTLIVFLPWAAPAPPPTLAEQSLYNLPGWFTMLRPVLVPSELFKGIAIALGHSKSGTESYLMGQWVQGGWWYYFPLAFLLKSPIAYVLLVAGGLWRFIPKMKSAPSLGQIAWLGAAVYLAVSMTSGINLGVRHLLPMLPLLSVGIGCAFAQLTSRRLRLAALAAVAWLAVTALVAYPLYIQFFSEAVGGARNGYLYLIDSNYDWGQDANRLKQFLDERQIRHIYLDYYGTQFSTEYLKIPNTRVSAEGAKQLQQGTLVVSVSELMRPEWEWLRQSRSPIARVAYTLFVYQFP
jgi:4-amino-4-deoxy-L-arabinose transferase-like glycosyltransferase